MLSIKKKIWMPAVASIIALSLQACAFGTSDTNHREYTPVSNGFIEETVLIKEESDDVEVVRSTMTKVLSNEYAELYIGEAYDVALIDTRTGKVWFSNEELYGEETDNLSDAQKVYAYSQVILEYYRGNEIHTTISSFPDCYDGESRNGATYEVTDEVLSVCYNFGYDLEEMVVFEYISNSLMEEMESRAQTAIEEGSISSSEWGKMERFYSPVSGKEYYRLRADMNMEVLVKFGLMMIQMGYTPDDVRAELEKLGSDAVSQYTSPSFQITLNYALDGADLVVSVNPSEIVEPDENYLGRLFVLPAMGANTTSDEGYTVLSDGTLIQNSTTTAETGVSVGFYGNDEALERRYESELRASTPFPVYGIKTGDSALFSIVESGDAVSGLDIMRSNSVYVRNMVAPWFTYHVRTLLYIGENTSDFICTFTKDVLEQPFVMRYHFLYDTRASYNGMADYYRSYLVSTGSLSETEEGSAWYEDVNVVGGVAGTKNVMGITMDATLSASDYASVQNWITNLGIEQSLLINYEGLFNGGVDGVAPVKLSAISELGSKNELKTLLSKENVYPALSIQAVAKEGNGISQSNDFARTDGKNYVSISSYNLATGSKKKTVAGNYLLSPSSYEKVVSGLAKAYQKYDCNQILVKDAASLLYSDFDPDGGFTMEDAKLHLCDALAQLKDAGFSLKLDGINVYALKYGTAFTNVSTESQLLKYADAEIPFVGLVLHGMVPYSVEPLNEASRYEEALLDMIEYGANPGWRLITGNMSVLDDTKYTCFYSADASTWSREITALNESLADFYTATAKETIEEHSILENGLVRVTYSNGYKAYINRTDETLKDGSVTVNGNSYYLCNKEGIEQ